MARTDQLRRDVLNLRFLAASKEKEAQDVEKATKNANQNRKIQQNNDAKP